MVLQNRGSQQINTDPSNLEDDDDSFDEGSQTPGLENGSKKISKNEKR
jgi:hypothetical protein